MVSRSALILFLVATAGCSAEVGDELDSGAQRPGSTETAAHTEAVVEGRVALERQRDLGRDSESAAVRADVYPSQRATARFLRVTRDADPALVASLVGSSDERQRSIAFGCHEIERASWRRASSLHDFEQGSERLRAVGDLAIELLDVGEVSLVAGDERHPLSPRAFPTVAELVSGMVYTSRDDSRQFPRSEPFALEAAGSSDVDAFRIGIDSPPPLADLRLADLDADRDELTVVRGREIVLRWRPETSGDRVTVRFESGAEKPSYILCAFPDEGQARIPSRFVQHRAGLELSIMVTRQRRQQHVVSPLDRVVIDFDDTVRVRAIVTD